MRSVAAVRGAGLIVLDGPIGDPGESDSVYCRDVVSALALCSDAVPVIRVTSWGGSADEGVAIAAAIRRDGRPIVTRIHRIAASSGALIALAGSRIEIEADACLMFHGGWVFVPGDDIRLGIAAGLVDEANALIAAELARLSGRPFADEIEKLNAGTDIWYSADEALSEGYAHAIVPATRWGRHEQ